MPPYLFPIQRQKTIDENLEIIRSYLKTHHLFRILAEQPSLKAAIQSPAKSRSKEVNAILKESRREIRSLHRDRSVSRRLQEEMSLDVVMSTLMRLYRLEGQYADSINDGRYEALQRDEETIEKIFKPQTTSAPRSSQLNVPYQSHSSSQTFTTSQISVVSRFSVVSQLSVVSQPPGSSRTSVVIITHPSGLFDMEINQPPNQDSRDVGPYLEVRCYL